MLSAKIARHADVYKIQKSIRRTLFAAYIIGLSPDSQTPAESTESARVWRSPTVSDNVCDGVDEIRRRFLFMWWTIFGGQSAGNSRSPAESADHPLRSGLQ